MQTKMMTFETAQQRCDEIVLRTSAIRDALSSNQIKDEETYLVLVQCIRDAKLAKYDCEEFMKDIVDSAYKNWKHTTGKRALMVKPLEELIARFTPPCIAWEDAKDIAIRAEQERANAALRKQQDDQTLAAVTALAEQDMTNEALQIIDAPAPMAPVMHPPSDRPEGLNRVVRWKADVYDEDALWRLVVAGKAPREFVTWDMKVLDALAKALKSKFTQYEGLRAVEDKTYAKASGR